MVRTVSGRPVEMNSPCRFQKIIAADKAAIPIITSDEVITTVAPLVELAAAAAVLDTVDAKLEAPPDDAPVALPDTLPGRPTVTFAAAVVPPPPLTVLLTDEPEAAALLVRLPEELWTANNTTVNNKSWYVMICY